MFIILKTIHWKKNLCSVLL